MIKRRFRFILLIPIFFSFIVLSLALGSLISDDEFMYLLQRKKNAVVTKYKIKEIENNEYSVINTGMTEATSGYGLNLMLINELDEGYTKDVLSCLKKSEEGAYDSSKVKLTVEASCGASFVETSVYSGLFAIKSYIPSDSNGKPIWNTSYNGVPASSMTLEKFDNTVAAVTGYQSGITANNGRTVTSFQYDTWNSRQTVAGINGAGNSGRSIGDYYYYPDVLATNNKYISGFIYGTLGFDDSITQDDFNSDWLAFMYMTAHNRGEGGAINYLFGSKYNSSSTAFRNMNNITNEDILRITNSEVSLYSDYRAKYPQNYDIIANLTGSDSLTIPAALLAVWNSDWYISRDTAVYLNNNLNTAVDYWNTLFPDEQIDGDNLRNKIIADSKSYADVINSRYNLNISGVDTNIVYGTATDGDDYDVWGYSNTGFIFKVTDIQSPVYTHTYRDGTQPYVVHCMDLLCAREALAACMGDGIYAKMLYYAGLGNVDPTNPSTYYSQISSSYVPSNLNWLSTYSVDSSSLSTNQCKILQTAYNIVNLPNCVYCDYSSNLAGSTDAADANVEQMTREYNNNSKPTMLDCSTFVCRVYKDSGYSGFASRMTCTTLKSSPLFRTIKPEELQPGDLIISDSHAMIYLSGSCSSGDLVHCTVMESNTILNTQFNRNGPNIRVVNGSSRFANDTSLTSTTAYYCLRLKERDTTTTKIGSY